MDQRTVTDGGSHNTGLGMSIFSTENFKRICREQIEAITESKQLSLAKLVNKERLNDNFFYEYKKMSMSSNNLYRALKSPEQIREDKAVQVFFRKQIQQMSNEYLQSLTKKQRRQAV